jgi:hypothetical protein
MSAAKVSSGGRGTALRCAASLLDHPEAEPGHDRRPVLADDEVVVQATWLGLAAPGEGGLGGQVAAIVTTVGAGATLRPGARVLVCGEPAGLGHGVCAERDLLPIPDAVTPSLALLAWSLAIARRVVAELPEGTQRVLLRGYRELGALVHAELDRSRPGVQVTVVETGDRAARLAVAFGARLAENAHGSHDVELVLTDDGPSRSATVIDLSAATRPGAQDVADALDLLAARTWRYVPIITDGLTVDEARSGVRPDDVVKAVVCL